MVSPYLLDDDFYEENKEPGCESEPEDEDLIIPIESRQSVPTNDSYTFADGDNNLWGYYDGRFELLVENIRELDYQNVHYLDNGSGNELLEMYFTALLVRAINMCEYSEVARICNESACCLNELIWDARFDCDSIVYLEDVREIPIPPLNFLSKILRSDRIPDRLKDIVIINILFKFRAQFTFTQMLECEQRNYFQSHNYMLNHPDEMY